MITCPECQRLGLDSKISEMRAISFPPYKMQETTSWCSLGHNWSEKHFYDDDMKLVKVQIDFFVSK